MIFITVLNNFVQLDSELWLFIKTEI